MNQNLKKMISYYKPYRAVFAADMLFATLSAAVGLTIPLVGREICRSGTDHSTGCAVCDIDSDLSAAPDDVAETFFDWHRIVCASGIGLLQPVFYRKLWTCDGGKNGI